MSLNIIGDAGSHDTLLNILSKLKPSNILDIPCGEGILSKKLDHMGWEVHCGDIDKGNFRWIEHNFKEINLNKKLPYLDNTYDVIVCVNGIHRIYNIGGAITEFSRILKPGGRLYINVNNYSSLDRRIRFLLIGSINDMVNSGTVRQTISNPEAYVRIAITFPQIAMALEKNGFLISQVLPSAVRMKHRVLLPISWIIKFMAIILVKNKENNLYYLKYMNSKSINPGGGYLLIEAVKNDP